MKRRITEEQIIGQRLEGVPGLREQRKRILQFTNSYSITAWIKLVVVLFVRNFDCLFSMRF